MLLDGFYHLFPFTDGSRHGFFAPNVLAFPCSIHTHDAMPVRRGGYVDNVYFRQTYKLPVIGKCLYPRILKGAHGYFNMPLIDVTDGYCFSTGILEVTAAHTSNADDAFGKMVTRSKKTFAQYMPWHNRNSTQCQKRSFDEFPSGIF